MQPSESYNFPSTDKGIFNERVIPQYSSELVTNIFPGEANSLGGDTVSCGLESEGNLHFPQNVGSSNTVSRENKGFEFEKMLESTFVGSSNVRGITHETNQIDSEVFPIHPSYSSPNVFFASPPSKESTSKNDNFSESHEFSEENFDDSQSLPQKIYVKSPENAYLSLVPLINKSNPSNICGLLVETLRLCSHQIPLDDFFVLLYGDVMPSMNSTAVPGPKFDEAEKQFTAEGLRLCELILKTLKFPGIAVASFAAGLVDNKKLFPIKFNEVQRNFLAIKIVCDSLVEVHGPLRANSRISRPSINHAYSIICEQLINQYPLISEAQSIKQGMIIGQSQLGKIIRMMYPDLTVRRIGKRGLSSYYYVGFQWNKSIIRGKVYSEMEERIQDRMKIKRSPKQVPKDVTVEWYKSQVLKKNKPNFLLDVRCSPIPNSSTCISSGFINMNSKYPKENCFPIQGYSCGEIPDLSEWAKTIMTYSIDALKEFSINLDPLVENFNVKICFSSIPNFLFDNFLSTIKSLSDQKSPEKSYLHLFLVFLLLLLPLTLTSDKELSCEKKHKFRESLQTFITSLQAEAQSSELLNSHSLLYFIDILKRMMNLTSLGQASVKTKLVKQTIKAVICDIDFPASDLEKSFGLTKNKEDVALRSVIKATKALNSEFFVNGVKADAECTKEIIFNVSTVFSEFCDIVIESYKRIPNSLTDEDLIRDVYDLPFEIFRISLIVFHKLCISNALVVQLPILMISYIAHEVHRGFHSSSFNDFSTREKEVSQETFKTWWAVSSMVGEYDGIMSQIAALSERLSIG